MNECVSVGNQYAIEDFIDDLQLLQSELKYSRGFMLCECGYDRIVIPNKKSRSRQVQNTFTFYFYAEALYQTGLHNYQRAKYNEHIRYFGVPIYFYFHHANTGSRPHAILRSIKKWNSEDIEHFERCLVEYLVFRCDLNANHERSSAGLHLLFLLSEDPDVTREFDGTPSAQAVAKVPSILKAIVNQFGHKKTRYL